MRDGARRFAVTAALAAVTVGGAVALTACGSDDDSAPVPASSSVVASTSASTSAAPSSSTSVSKASPSTSTRADDAERPSMAPLPSDGTTTSIPKPAAKPSSQFLGAVRKAGLDLDDDYAVSLGTSVCETRKTGGQKSAEQFASPAIQAATKSKPSATAVTAFVNASRDLC